MNVDEFKNEINAILDNDLELLADINGGDEVPSVKAFLEIHYGAHNEVRLGSFFNEAIETNAFTDDKAYIMFHRKDDDAVARVFIGSDAEIIGRFYETGELSKEFTMGHEPDSQLYKVAVGVAKDLGKDLSNNEHIFDVNDIRIANKKELGVNTFSEWLKPELEQYAALFPNIQVDDVMKVLDDTDFYFHESMRDLITEGRFNKDVLKSPEALLSEIHNVGKSLHEISHGKDFEKVESAFNVDVEALSDYDKDDLEEELDSAFPEPKKKPNVKP